MADFYFGASTPDYDAQWEPMGVGSSNIRTVMNSVDGFTLVTPAGGILITELARGMDSSTGQTGITFPIGVYDITNGVANATLLVQATGTSRVDNAGYVWHTVTGLNTTVPAGRTIAVASAPPSGLIWHTRNVEGASYFDDGSAETTMPATWTQTGTQRVIPLRAGYSLLVSPPTLNNLNTDNIVRVGSTANTVNTAGLGALTSLTVGGKAAINISAPSGDGTFDMPSFVDGVSYSLMGSVTAVVGDGTATDDLPVTLLPMDGWNYVTLSGTLNTTNTGTIFNFSPVAAVGDQIVFPLSHVVYNNGDVDTDLDGTVTFWHIASNGTARSFNFTTGISGSDNTPNVFDFTDVTNQPLNTLVESNTVTITGMDNGTAVSVVGCEYSLNGAAYTSAPGTMNSGQTIRLRRTTSTSPGVQVSASITVGAVTADWLLTTVAADTTPDTITFNTVSNAALSTQQTSNTITVSGLNTSATVTITNGTYSKNGGAFVSTSGSVVNGDTLAVRHTSSSSVATSVVTTVNVGTASPTFTSTTVGADTTPDTIVFNSVSNVPVSTQQTSNTVTISGINTSTPISIVNGTYSVNGGSFVSTSGSVVNGNTVQVRHTSSASTATAVITTLTVGTASSTFTSTTVGADTTIDPIAFTTLFGQTVNTQVTSNTATISGINTTTPISIVGGLYNKGAGYVSTPGTLSSGDSLTLRHTTSVGNNQATISTVTIGGVAYTFTSVTVGAPSSGDDTGQSSVVATKDSFIKTVVKKFKKKFRKR